MAIFCWWVILNVMRPTMRGRNTPKYFGRDEIISHTIRPPLHHLPLPPLLLQQMKRGLTDSSPLVLVHSFVMIVALLSFRPASHHTSGKTF